MWNQNISFSYDASIETFEKILQDSQSYAKVFRHGNCEEECQYIIYLNENIEDIQRSL